MGKEALSPKLTGMGRRRLGNVIMFTLGGLVHGFSESRQTLALYNVRSNEGPTACRADGNRTGRRATSPRELPSLLALAAILALQGCKGRDVGAKPSIELTRIPPAAQGGREHVDTISGRVQGWRDGQSIVVYARSGPWWVQPWPDRPLITIQSDSTWSTETHLGFEYAAMLVGPGYHPAPTLDVLPSLGPAVLAIASVKGTGAIAMAPTRALQFSGYDWKVRTISSDRGGLNNLYDGDNAWIDEKGALHLRIKKQGDKWSCAEVVSTRSFGYGTYTMVVRDVSQLEPASVLSMTTFDDWGGEQHYREMDAEFGRWGEPERTSNAQFGIQPYYVPANQSQYVAPAGPLTVSMRWESGRASFTTVRGGGKQAASGIVAKHVFTSGVPTPGRETIQFLFYVVGSERKPQARDAEVVIEKFEYLP